VPRRSSTTIIGDGFAERSDPAALVVGPTGLGLGSDGSLYVADTVNNRITMIGNAQSRHTSAGRGAVFTRGGMLAGPLGLTVLPGGDVLTVNSANGKLVETSPAGRQVASRSVDRAGSPPGAGALFGLAAAGKRLWFVDDVTNTLDLLR
jgi:sugar lactone lactonase YvrE